MNMAVPAVEGRNRTMLPDQPTRAWGVSICTSTHRQVLTGSHGVPDLLLFHSALMPQLLHMQEVPATYHDLIWSNTGWLCHRHAHSGPHVLKIATCCSCIVHP